MASTNKNKPAGYHMALAKEIGPRIKKLREEMKLTQDEFSKRLKIHSKQMSRYEAGYNVPMLEITARIANFCEVSTDYIIFGDDKNLNRKTRINDPVLLDYFRQANKLKKSDREKFKWAIKSILTGNSSS